MGKFHIIRDREMIQYKYMEEEDHFTQTQLPALIIALMIAAIAALHFLSWSLYCTHNLSQTLLSLDAYL